MRECPFSRRAMPYAKHHKAVDLALSPPLASACSYACKLKEKFLSAGIYFPFRPYLFSCFPADVFPIVPGYSTAHDLENLYWQVALVMWITCLDHTGQYLVPAPMDVGDETVGLIPALR